MIPSHFSFRATLLTFFLALTDSAQAHPSKPDTSPNEIRATSPNLSAYRPVLTDGTASLPSPTGTLKSITLGRGTQNYTCASSASTPISDGATAALFNVAQLLPTLSISQGQAVLNGLPNALVGDTVAQIAQSGLPVIGEHHFTAAGVPTWDLFGEGLLLYGSGVGDIAAPAGANAGPQGYGAVDWKALTGAAGSVGLTEVYRVETAGGKAPTSCSGSGATIEVQYAAMYWFYE
ncbi:hypothetical protein HO133_009494 [Letharia lupina]|uniref:Malate dehydrogenase n=1 Tax=Letharia lupina TaxID=560253 RepID=A0A8H6CL04_9LECA|nr:uncharacterized protein HO133_009494 [Letharia lupina]KAF6225494.1 hypothetical protein HO133_009494 [Letharia lupina]